MTLEQTHVVDRPTRAETSLGRVDQQNLKPLPILKGADFASRIEQICREFPPVEPLADLRYRRILIPGMWGGENIFSRMGFIGLALKMRGAEVTALLCDSLLPACAARKIDHQESACTRWCHKNAAPFAQAMRLEYRWYSEFISPQERVVCETIAEKVAPEDIPDLEWRGVLLGEHVLRTIESHFKMDRFDPDNPKMAAKARDFVLAALYLRVIAEHAIDELKIDKLVVLDGFKNTWGVPRAVASQAGVPVDILDGGAKGLSYRCSRDRPYEGTQAMPEWRYWRELPLTPPQEHALDQYMLQREVRPYGCISEDWFGHSNDPEMVRRTTGLPSKTRGLVFAMFPNVSFDAPRTKTKPAFDYAHDWVVQTVSFMSRWPQHHLAIKIHPAEYHFGAQDPLDTWLQQRVGELPANIHLIPPQTDITAHAVMRMADVALVYNSTVAVEAAVLNTPVILVGGGWSAARGITVDVSSAREYFHLLNAICSGKHILETRTQLARRYAYSLFFRLDIPINHFSVEFPHVTELHIDSLAEIVPGADPAMDVICRGILRDEPFCMPDSI